MNLFSAKNRNHLIKIAKSKTYDLIIIGGGVTGAGIALDATLRGLNVILFEKEDYAYGTSSKSTKLVHGGLRYLKQFEIALVREVGSERAIVHKLAPHLVIPEKMLLPLIKGGTYGKTMTSIGLKIYDYLADVEGEDRRVMFSKEETIEQEPLLKNEIVEGGGYYAEYRTDDARLTTEIIKTAVNHGATCINHIKVLDFKYIDNKVKGVIVNNQFSNTTFSVNANFVVNAAGPWVDTMRKINNSLDNRHLFLSKGVHLVIPYQKLPIKQSIYFDVPDGRMIFAIPRDRITYVGTTDTKHQKGIDEVRTNLTDVEYLLNAVNNIFPTLNLKPNDVESSWAGLRPLIHEKGKSASEISRKDEIFISDTGLISIAGGKLTGYRKMAERVVNVISEKYTHINKKHLKGTSTDRQVLIQNNPKNSKEVLDLKKEIIELLIQKGIDIKWAYYLTHNFGRNACSILKTVNMALQNKEQALLEAEARYTIHFEQCCSPVDFFIRRTGRLYFYINTIKPNMEFIFKVFKKELNLSDIQLTEYRHELNESICCATKFN